MRKAALAVLCLAALGLGQTAWAQLTAEQQAAYDTWEDFLKTAKVVAQEQITGPLAVTNPWVLTLEKDGVRHKAVWKDIFGERIGGFKETWKGEIAAYRLSRALGLNMVPVTVEREFQGDRGSCQLWVDNWNTLETIMKKKLSPPGIKALYFARALCLQRAFDNLIYNVDRHQRNYLIMEDWRMILIDHSRSFGTSGRFTKTLLFSARSPDGPMLMSELPRSLVERVKALDLESVRAAVGKYLSESEVRAVLVRRDLVLQEIDRIIRANGEDKVLY